MTTPTTAAALLSAARTELDRRGWTQHHWQRPTGQVCLAGALCLAAGSPPDDGITAARLVGGVGPFTDAVDALAGQLPDRTNYPAGINLDCLVDIVIAWNDRDGRTLDQVHTLLDTTITTLNTTSTPADTR